MFTMEINIGFENERRTNKKIKDKRLFHIMRIMRY
jgi:hypothetical protein